VVFKLVDVCGVEIGAGNNQHPAVSRNREIFELGLCLRSVCFDRVARLDFDDQVVLPAGGDDHVGDVFVGRVVEVGERAPRVRTVAVEVIGVQRRVRRKLEFEVVHRVLYDIVVVFVRTDEGCRTD